jgi:RNA polymerase sigma-70 factor (ECF subfamily)
MNSTKNHADPVLPRVARGEAGAARECVLRYQSFVRALARRYARDERDRDDACQDVFLALWRSAGVFDPSRGDEAAFVALVARRRLVDRHRTPGTRPLPIVEAPADPTGAALEAYVDARTAAAALADCNEGQRRVILMSTLQGLTYEEIARELSIPLGTVKSHYARGIERLKDALSRPALARGQGARMAPPRAIMASRWPSRSSSSRV